MIQFSPPHIKQEAVDEVINTLKSGWITTGPKTKLFEKKLTEYCGNKKTLCMNSATAGLELILRWFGVKKDDEVIIPAYTYCATANVVVHCGAKPVMVDINDNDFNISVEKIQKAITEKTKVIIPVDIAGLPACYNEINKLVDNKNIKKLFNPENEQQKKLGRILVLSDAAHSFGAEYKNKKTGNLTDITVFSFHAVKNLTTGEGGAIALNLPEPFDNELIYKSLNIKSLHGQSKDALAKSKIGSWQYDVIYTGFKANMTDINASLGLVALKYYDTEDLPRRKEIITKYTNSFSKYKWAELPVIKDCNRQTSYHLYMLRIKNISEKQRNEIIQKIFEQAVSVNVHFQPLPMLSIYKKKGYNIENYPFTYDSYSREISLPVYYNLSDKDTKKVIEAVVKSIEAVIN